MSIPNIYTVFLQLPRSLNTNMDIRQIYASCFREGRVLVYGGFTLDEKGESLILKAARGGCYDPFGQLKQSKVDDTLPPYLEFANLDPNDPQALLAYANTHGIPDSLVLNYPAIDLNKDWKKKVKSAIEQMASIAKVMPYPLIEFEREINSLKLLLAVKRVADGDTSSILVKKFDEVIKKGFSNKSRQETAAHFMREWIEKKLKGVRLSMNIYSKNGSLSYERRYRYKNLRQALYATLFDDIANPIQKCGDIKCKNYFVVEPKGKMYCSNACAVRVAKRASYHRLKDKKKAKPKKKKR